MITMKTMLTINHVDVVDSCIHDKEGDKDESNYNRGNQVFSHYHTRKSKKTVVLFQVHSSFLSFVALSLLVVLVPANDEETSC
jgi:hypothetical protein